MRGFGESEGRGGAIHSFNNHLTRFDIYTKQIVLKKHDEAAREEGLGEILKKVIVYLDVGIYFTNQIEEIILNPKKKKQK